MPCRTRDDVTQITDANAGIQFDQRTANLTVDGRNEFRRRIADARDKWSQELLPGLLDDNRAFPVGYREFPTTWLPARDGDP